MYCLQGIFKVGLTGGIGSGKSTISEMIREKNVPVIDEDKISREVLRLYPEILIEVKEVFGKEFLDDNGDLKRREFGSYIFRNKNKRIEYENIIITKLDETSTYGSILTILDKGKKPISFITTGQDVPDDIKEGNKEEIAKIVLGENKLC